MSLLKSVVARRPVPAPGSALPRPLDLTFPSNRTAVYGTLAATGLALLLGRSWRQALGVGGVAMLGWATGRELDPDYPATAALALGLSGVAGFSQTARGGASAPAVLPGMAALSATRMLTATVGAAASPQDAVMLSIQAGLAALRGHPTGALLPSAALALSAAEGDALRPAAVWSAPLALGAGLLPSRRTADAGAEGPRHLWSDLLSLGALSLSRSLVAPETPRSRCDLAPRSVSGPRLQASRMLAQGALAVGLLRRESATLVPLAAACLGTGLRRARPSLIPALGRR